MKQRIIVQVILTDLDDNILLLRRSTGRAQYVGLFELPGGTVQDFEQPDDALRRHMKSDAGVDLGDVSLVDALNVADRENRDLEQVFIVYKSSLAQSKPKITPRGSYDSYDWASKENLESYSLRDSAAMILNVPRDVSAREYQRESFKESSSRYVLYSDGGSRGNPGPSAAAFIIIDNEKGQIVEQDGVYLGITTNNQAEYHGLRLGIERAIEKGILILECRLDSMLVVNQLNGSYHIKNRELWPIFERIRSYLPQFEKINFIYVPREENKEADALVNKLLDQHQNDTM